MLRQTPSSRPHAGNAALQHCFERQSNCPARPATVNAYYRILRALFNFLLNERVITEHPLRNVKAPKVPADQIQPFSAAQVQSMLDAARRSRAPERNHAVILLLVDTGMRVSELARLTIADVDRGTSDLLITGKGNKKRTVFMSPTCRRALWKYVEAERRNAGTEEPLFVSVGGRSLGSPLQHTGVHEIVRKAGDTARITSVRCSPHTLRHTFAVNFLRGGGNLLVLQQLMGHEDLTVLQRYVALAQSDLAQAHRRSSPVMTLGLR